MNMETPHLYPEVRPEDAESESSPETREISTLYSSARDEDNPDNQLELLRQIESRLHVLLEPEVSNPPALSDQDLRNVMLYETGEFWLGSGTQGQRIKFESERFNPGLQSSDGKPKWMRYPEARTIGRETYERFIEIFGSNCVDIAPETEADSTGM